MTWGERIKRAEAVGGFDEEDLDLAREWVTCACGEQDPRIPRFRRPSRMQYFGEPKDALLSELGLEFYDAVKRDRMDVAETVLSAIEKRAGEILAGMA